MKLKTNARFEVEGLEDQVADLESRMDTLQTRNEGEQLYGALLSLTDGRSDMTEVKEILQLAATTNVDMKAVVNYKDVGGMTPLHRAARLGSTWLVETLMGLKADANATT